MKYAVFNLGEKEYGVDIAQVREVIRLRPITPIPDTSIFVEGVISLHGKVVPIVNLRIKFGEERKELLKSNRIIVTKVHFHEIGVIVDGVTDVLSCDSTSMNAPDEVLKEVVYLVGVVKKEERLILIVDMDKLLNEDTSSQIQRIHEKIELRRK
jgi:purine-binding chemotaxis protein CheW